MEIITAPNKAELIEVFSLNKKRLFKRGNEYIFKNGRDYYRLDEKDVQSLLTQMSSKQSNIVTEPNHNTVKSESIEIVKEG